MTTEADILNRLHEHGFSWDDVNALGAFLDAEGWEIVPAQATAAARAEVARQVRELAGRRMVHVSDPDGTWADAVPRFRVLALLEDAAPRQPEPETRDRWCGHIFAGDVICARKPGHGGDHATVGYREIWAAPDTTTGTTDE